MNRTMRLLLAIAALAGSTATPAEDRPWHPYREVCEKLGLVRFFEMPEAQRDQLRLLFKVRPRGSDAQPLILTINAAAHPIRITPDAKGLIDFPFDRQLLADNPDVLINLPPGEKASFTPDLQPTLPRELQLDYVRLMGGIPQANALIRKQAGLLRIFVPTLRKLVLRYDRADGQQVSVGDGAATQHFRIGPSSEIVIPFDDVLFSKNVGVELSDRPKSMDFAE